MIHQKIYETTSASKIQTEQVISITAGQSENASETSKY